MSHTRQTRRWGIATTLCVVIAALGFPATLFANGSADTSSAPPARTSTLRERALARAAEVDEWNDLFAAVVTDDTSRVRALKDAGGDIAVRDVFGRSLRDVARAYDLTGMLDCLRGLGAMPSAAEIPQDQPLLDAVATGEIEAVEKRLAKIFPPDSLKTFYATPAAHALALSAAKLRQPGIIHSMADRGLVLSGTDATDRRILQTLIENRLFDAARSLVEGNDFSAIRAATKEVLVDEMWVVPWNLLVQDVVHAGDPQFLEWMDQHLLHIHDTTTSQTVAESALLFRLLPEMQDSEARRMICLYLLDQWPTLPFSYLEMLCRTNDPVVVARAADQLAVAPNRQTAERPVRNALSAVAFKAKYNVGALVLVDRFPDMALPPQNNTAYGSPLLSSYYGNNSELFGHILDHVTSGVLFAKAPANNWLRQLVGDDTKLEFARQLREKQPAAWAIVEQNAADYAKAREVTVSAARRSVVLTHGVTTATLANWSGSKVTPDAYYVEKEERKSEWGDEASTTTAYYLRFPGRKDEILFLDEDVRQRQDHELLPWEDLSVRWLRPDVLLLLEWNTHFREGHNAGTALRHVIAVTHDAVQQVGKFETNLGWLSGGTEVGGSISIEYNSDNDDIVVHQGGSTSRTIKEDERSRWESECLLAGSVDKETGAKYWHSYIKTDERYLYRFDSKKLVYLGGEKHLKDKNGTLLLDIADAYKTTVAELRRLNPNQTSFYAEGDLTLPESVQSPLREKGD